MLLPLGLLNCTLCEAGNPPIPGTLRSQAQGPKGRSLGVSFFFKQAFFLMCTICQAFIEFVTIFNECFYICFLYISFFMSPGEGNGHPLQYSCLEDLMDGGAW